MNRRLSFAPILAVTVLLGLGAVTVAQANHLAAPTNLTCSDASGDGDLDVHWDASVAGATKQAIEFSATYLSDPPQEFDIGLGTGTNDLEQLLTGLYSTPNGQAPIDVDVKVKGLHPGKGQGRQNNAQATADCGVT